MLAGATAFLFSTVVITFGGEILPQAYFSRNALRMAAALSPAMRFYQIVLFPFSKPTALFLDRWLGREAITYLGERDLRRILRHHIEAEDADVERIEGTGALNFLAIDDVPVTREGEPLDPRSIIELPDLDGDLDLPIITDGADSPFLREVNASGHPWVILTDRQRRPHYALDADGLVRAALMGDGPIACRGYCHRPIVVTDPGRAWATTSAGSSTTRYAAGTTWSTTT